VWSGRQTAGKEASTAYDNTHAMGQWLAPAHANADSFEHHFELPANSKSFARSMGQGIAKELFSRQQQLRAFQPQHILGQPKVQQPGIIGKTTTVQGALNAASANVGVYKARRTGRTAPGASGGEQQTLTPRAMAAKTPRFQMLWNAQKTQPYNPMQRIDAAGKVNQMILNWQHHADHHPAGSYSDY